MDYDKTVQSVIEEYQRSPIDMLATGDTAGEYKYVSSLKASYVRTVRDVDSLFDTNKSNRSILEIGSFLGAVSISLKKLGYDVRASDIPEFHQSGSLRALYERSGIPFDGVNLRHRKLPYESGSLDAVIICEVMEHLNFNPLPVLLEINRVLKTGGYVYIGMPNQSSIHSRLRLLSGRSIHNPIDDFFKQLDRTDNKIVGLHWREYTLAETVEMIERMGFAAVQKYYFSDETQRPASLKDALRRLAYSYPPFRPYQVVIGRKTENPSYDFWITEANS
jgi:SAM-dependent methyltransferase